MKKILTLILLAAFIVAQTACSSISAGIPTTESTVSSETTEPVQQISNDASNPIVVEYDPDDLTVYTDSVGTTSINLDGNMITVDGGGTNVEGNTVTIVSAGVYSLSGVLDDGQIIVDTQDAETVVLILKNAMLTSSTSSPIYVASAEKVVITLAEGTNNFVTDGTTYYFPDEEDEPNAAIFSKDDLTINGNGSLTVNANYNNGIVSKDDLKIISGNITVNAINDGIKGRDLIAIKDGTLTVNTGADGLQANNDEDPEKGNISIEGGTLEITSGLDGIQAATNLQVNGGDITITTGGGSANNSTDGGGMWGGRGMEGNPNKPAESAKGLKAGVNLTITAGRININSADDSLHANGSIKINNGGVLLASGDDGIHADSTLEINGGDIAITQSYEGLESAVITINGGTIHLVASDDGINAAGGTDGSSVNGRPGQNNFDLNSNYHLYVNGGYIFVSANGDGIDINGSIDITNGTVIVNGPTNDGNGPLDYLGTFNISGGFLIAVGSSGMAQAPSDSSTQYAVMHNFETKQPAGSLVHIVSGDGDEILTFTPTKEYQSVLFSSPALKNGGTYLIYTAGSSTGTVIDGLYSNGIYTAGTQVVSITIANVVTISGLATRGNPGGPGGVPGGPFGPGGAAPPTP